MGARYVWINPERVLDTHLGTGLTGRFVHRQPRTFQVAGVGGVPAGAIAITGNLTVVGQTSRGYVSLGPVMSNAPTTSTVNFPLRDVRSNGVTVPLAGDGTLSAVFVGSTGATTQLLLDVTGYFVAPPGDGATYVPVDPARVLDTHLGTGLTGRFVHRQPRTFQVAGVGGVPAGAIAITGNLTVVGQTSRGYVSLGPVMSNAPTTSTVNFPLRDVRSNGVTVPLSLDGRLSATFVGGSKASTHLVFDVTGYFVGGPPLSWLPDPYDPDLAQVPEGVTRLGETVQFRGTGYGHGVGLSQYGALGRATAGQTASEILGHYYQGTSLGSVDPNLPVRILVLSAWVPTETVPLRIVGRGGTWTMDGTSATFPADATLSVRWPLSGTSAWRFRVTATNGSVLHDGTSTSAIRVYPGTGARLELPTKPTAYDEYRGVLRVIPASTSVSVVNEVGLDAYLGGVVPAEMPSGWHAEALRVQAIAARSYAVYRLRPTTGTFDVYDDTRSQVYRGLLGEKSTTNEAIAATAGVIVTESGAVANTLFHSTGGGATEHNENAFVSSSGSKVAGPVSLLRGSPDVDANGIAFDASSPWATWQTAALSRSTLSAWLGADPRTSVGMVAALDLRDRGVSGRLISVTIYGTGGTTKVSGDVFRAVFNANVSGSAIIRANSFDLVAGD